MHFHPTLLTGKRSKFCDSGSESNDGFIHRKSIFLKVFHERAKHKFVSKKYPYKRNPSKIKGSRRALIPPDTTTKKEKPLKPLDFQGVFLFLNTILKHFLRFSGLIVPGTIGQTGPHSVTNSILHTVN